MSRAWSAGDAIIGGKAAQRNAQADRPADKRQAARHGLLLGRAIGQLASPVGHREGLCRRFLVAFCGLLCRQRAQFGPQRRRQHVPAHPLVIGLVEARIDMGDEARAQRDIDRAADRPLACGRAKATDQVDMISALRNHARDPPVDHVDRAADRLPAEQQGGGTAQHFDPLGGQRVDGHRMVGRSIADVDRADAVGQHPHPLALETAQHRPGRAGREAGRADARQADQRLADLGAAVARQGIAAQHGFSGEQVEVAHEWGGDHDRVVGVVMIMLLGSVSGRGRGRGGLGGRRLRRKDGGGQPGASGEKNSNRTHGRTFDRYGMLRRITLGIHYIKAVVGLRPSNRSRWRSLPACGPGP